MKGNKEAVRSLIERRANVNAPQSDGTTALHWAVRSDNLEIAELLIRDGVTPLLLASVNGNAAMIERLIKAGADPKTPLTNTETPPSAKATWNRRVIWLRPERM